MTDPDRVEEMRQVAREVLRELVPEMLTESLADPHGNGTGNGSGNGNGGHPEDVVPMVPAPPVAAVLRPSTWTAPAAPGEVIGGRAPTVAPAVDEPPDGSVEAVTIDTDDDLQRFVRELISRLESPRERRAIRAGRLRFTLRRSSAAVPGTGTIHSGPATATVRIAKGAVTERAVREAAATGARLVLARGAVLTPLARDQVRALGVEIEREGKC